MNIKKLFYDIFIALFVIIAVVSVLSVFNVNIINVTSLIEVGFLFLSTAFTLLLVEKIDRDFKIIKKGQYKGWVFPLILFWFTGILLLGGLSFYMLYLFRAIF